MTKRLLSLLLALVTMLSVAVPAFAEGEDAEETTPVSSAAIEAVATSAAASSLDTPKLLSVSSGDYGIRLQWEHVWDAAQYRVFYKTESGSWTRLGETTDHYFTWTGGKAGSTYSFTVRCLSADGVSYTSGYDKTGLSITYTPTFSEPLPMPMLYSLEETSNSLIVRWGAVEGAAQYRVFYKTIGVNNNWKKLADTTSTSYAWTGAKNGGTYAFTVRCLSADGKSYTSAYDTTGKSILCSGMRDNDFAAPILLHVENVKNGVDIVWDKVYMAARYRVFYKTDGGSWKKAGDTAGTSYTWTGAKSGVKYSFTVRCLDADGNYISSYDKTGLSITYAPTSSGTLATPKLRYVTNVPNGVSVTWDPVPGAAKYRVFYKTGDGNWKKAGDTDNSAYTWTGAKNGVKYSFTVRCISTDGKSYTSSYDETGWSITHSKDLAAPQLRSVSNTSDGVTVKWHMVSGAAKYRVFYKTGSGSWKKIGDTTGSGYTWTGAKSGVKYSFTVRCLDTDGKYISSYDKTGLSITYKPASGDASTSASGGALATPRLSSVQNIANGVVVAWNAVTDAARYRVFYKTGSGSWKKAGDTTDTAYVWTGAKSGVKYSFTVRCVNADGSYASAYDAAGLSVTYTPTTGQASDWFHIHSWTAVTKTVHHKAVTEQVKIIDIPATEGRWEQDDEWQGVVICNTTSPYGCGAEFDTVGEFSAHSSEVFWNAIETKEGDPGHSNYTVYDWRDFIWHEGTAEVSHTETRTINAWDEEIITGYVCTDCGTTR